MRLLLYSPGDTAACAAAFAAGMAIIVNAMFLQGGRHPSPMFGEHVMTLRPAAMSSAPAAVSSAPAATSSAPAPQTAGAVGSIAPVNPLPRPRPAQADRRSEAVPAEAVGHAARPAADPIGHLVRTVAARNEAARREAEPPPSRRVMAVQQALSDYGYGQLKPTGQVGADTRAAIRRFEIARHLPVTGQIGERLLGELAATTGRRFD